MRGDRRTGTHGSLTNASGGSNVFAKPVDNIGMKTIPNYAAYAAQHIYTVNIPGCTGTGKVFVGQRKDPFAVNLGVIFDLLNVPGAADFTPAEAAFLLDNSKKDAGTDDLTDANVTSLALEVPTSCLVAGADPVIGGWTTASLRQGSLLSSAPKSGYQTSAIAGGAWTQVSRLGMPLVNEVVIGLPDKDKFNGSKPKDDGQFATYVTNPTLPALVEIALATPNIAPTNFPRNDLVTTFLTGIVGVNQPKAFATTPSTGVASEMLRLNTAIAPTAEASQNRLGLLGGLLAGPGGDLAGYPNGRRPNDDVVDISLIAVMGGLCVANGAGDTYKFGTACNPWQCRSVRRCSACTTASTRPARRSRPTVRCCRRSRMSARRCRVPSEEKANEENHSCFARRGGRRRRLRRWRRQPRGAARRPRRCRRARARRSRSSSPTCNGWWRRRRSMPTCSSPSTRRRSPARPTTPASRRSSIDLPKGRADVRPFTIAAMRYLYATTGALGGRSFFWPSRSAPRRRCRSRRARDDEVVDVLPATAGSRSEDRQLRKRLAATARRPDARPRGRAPLSRPGP